MKTKTPFLSVVIPVYNEEPTVEKLVKQVLKHLPKNSEIVIVNDGSTDGTEKILKKFSRRKNVHVHNLKKNRGKGHAIRYGFAKSKGEIIIIQDADLEYSPRYYKSLIKPITSGKTEVVYGTRLSKIPFNLHNLRTIPLPLNFIANKLLTAIGNFLYGIKLTDMETCYKLFTRSVYKKLNLTRNGFDIEAEITAQIVNHGYHIVEVPITTNPRTYQEGKKVAWTDAVTTVLTLLRYKINSYTLSIFGIFLIAVFYRFYRFTDRYALWSDQSRDALVGRVANATNTLPLIGSFSSAGPFTFGPYWYWQAMLVDLISPNHMGYWISTVIISLLMVLALIWLGYKIGGRTTALAAGLFAATSRSLSDTALSSTQHSMTGITVAFAMVTIYQYLNTKKNGYLYLSFFLIGLAVNYHYQALYIVPMLAILILVKWPGIIPTITASLFFILTFVPLIIFDIQHEFWNWVRLADHYRFGQHRVYVPNRWLTYAGVFWPGFWAEVVGGFRLVAYAIMASVGLYFNYLLLVKRKLNKSLFVYGLGFLVAIVWFRYFKAERFFGYVTYAQPLVIIFTAWIVGASRKLHRYLPLSLILLLTATNVYAQTKSLDDQNPRPAIMAAKQALIEYKPNQAFTLYDRTFESNGCSIPLSLVLDDQNLSTSHGFPIGVCRENFNCPVAELATEIYAQETGGLNCRYIDLTDYPAGSLESERWVLISPEEVHRMTVEWWRSMDSFSLN